MSNPAAGIAAATNNENTTVAAAAADKYLIPIAEARVARLGKKSFVFRDEAVKNPRSDRVSRYVGFAEATPVADRDDPSRVIGYTTTIKGDRFQASNPADLKAFLQKALSIVTAVEG